MKKSINIIKKVLCIFIITILVILIFVFGLDFYYKSFIKKENAVQKSFNITSIANTKPLIYCFITYKISTDNGQIWTKKIINNGQKSLYKSDCWDKYLEIVKNCKSKEDSNGTWICKINESKIISSPSLQISEDPFI